MSECISHPNHSGGECMDCKIEELKAQVAELEAQIKLMEEKAVTSFNCFWNGGWYFYADNE